MYTEHVVFAGFHPCIYSPAQWTCHWVPFFYLLGDVDWGAGSDWTDILIGVGWDGNDRYRYIVYDYVLDAIWAWLIWGAG